MVFQHDGTFWVIELQRNGDLTSVNVMQQCTVNGDVSTLNLYLHDFHWHIHVRFPFKWLVYHVSSAYH